MNPDTFLANLRAEMGTIASVGITRIAIQPLASGVVDVAAWSDLYEGELLVQLVPSSGGTPLPIGKVSVPAGGLEPLTATVTTSRGALDAAPDIAAGRFSVRLLAGSARAASDAFALSVRVEIELMAF